MEQSTKTSADYILENPTFASCEEIEIARMIPSMEKIQLKAGDQLFNSGDNPENLYILKTGKITIRSGKRAVDTIEPGRLVGHECAVGLDHYQADACVDEDAELIAIPRQSILPLMEQNKAFSANMHRSFLNMFTHVKNSMTEHSKKEEEIAMASPKIIIGWLLAIIVPVLVLYFGTVHKMDWDKMVFVAIASSTVVMWIFAVVPEFVPAIFSIICLVILGVVPESVVLAGFTSSSFFMAVGIFGLGALLLSSGLTYRIVLHLLKILPGNQPAFGMGLMSIGIALTPIIPSSNGRSNLIAPIFLDMMNTLRYQPSGKAATALAITAFSGISMFAPVFMTSKSVNFVVYGMLPNQVREEYSWLYWFIAGLAAAVVILVLLAIALKIMFRNTEIPAISRDKVEAQLKVLGPMQSYEWAALLGIIFLTLGILTGTLHKISPAWVALIILYVFLTAGMFSRQQFRSNIDWSFLFLLAGMIGIIQTMSHVKIDDWFSGQLTFLSTYMESNFNLFVLFLSMTILLVRLIIPNNPTILIFSAIFIPVAYAKGVSPWQVVFIILMMSDTWLMRYQCTYYLVFAETANKHKEYDEAALLKFNLLTILFRLAAIYVSIYYWDLIK